jgi:hypothetical protein
MSAAPVGGPTRPGGRSLPAMLVAGAPMARKEASHDTSAGLAIGLCLWWDRFGTGTDRNRQDRPRAGSAADDHVAQLTAIDCYRWIRPGPSSSTHVAGAARRGGHPVALRPLVALTVLATSHLMVKTPGDGGSQDVQEDPCSRRRGGGCRGRVCRLSKATQGGIVRTATPSTHCA